MRAHCYWCVTKHISQAIVLTIEAATGYPEHIWLASGHLAEAEAEILEVHPKFADRIREVRRKLTGEDPGFRKDSLMELLREARTLAENAKEEKDVDMVNRVLRNLKKDLNT